MSGTGFTVDAARDGVEALDKIDRHTFGVVLLDIQLPDVGGLDVLARCMSKPSPAKVVVITGVDTTDTALSALRGQAYDFLPKPIEPPRLLEIVKRALSTGRVAAAIEVGVRAARKWARVAGSVHRARLSTAFKASSTSSRRTSRRTSATRVGLAFRELLLNGIEWGGHLNPEQKVRVACLRTRRMLLYRIAGTRGRAFPSRTWFTRPPRTRRAPSPTTASARRRACSPGGFGLVLIRAIADELIYNERQNGRFSSSTSTNPRERRHRARRTETASQEKRRLKRDTSPRDTPSATPAAGECPRRRSHSSLSCVRCRAVLRACGRQTRR